MSNPIYPEQFFTLSHPATPNVQIQFRTNPEIPDLNQGLENPKYWESITFNPNNFFNDLSIEDEGGAKKLRLNLVDKNHSFLEDKIIRMTHAVQVANRKARKELEEKGDGFIKSFTSPAASIRIRIGYTGSNQDVINESSYSSMTFKNRVNESKMVIYSPWMYFIPVGMNVSVTAEGLQVEIEAVSELYPFFESMRITTKQARIYDEPKNIIKIIEMYLEDTIENFKVIVKDEPLAYINDQGNNKIEVPLIQIKSDEPQYMNASEVLNTFCNKVAPIMFDINGNLIQPQDYEDAKKDTETEHVSYNYSWMIEDLGGNGRSLTFYYRKPDREQSNIRTYTWFEHAQSIVREVSLTSEYLFSQLNLPIVMIDDEGNHVLYSVAKEEDDEGKEYYSSEDLSHLFDNDTFNFSFAGKIYEADTYEDSRQSISVPSGRMITGAISNLKEMLHQGSVTIQGDPFYLFDEKMVPFMYRIQLIIKKPTYIDENGERVGGGKSYLSGEYIVKKITHNVSAGEYTTQLEIQRAI